MRYADCLKELLAPLGVYDLSGGAGWGELCGIGAALDGCAGELDRVEREMDLTTAEDEGLEAVESLLSHRPVADHTARRRAALAALLRVGGDSFTLRAVNDNLAGCGIHAVAAEGAVPGRVEVRFPQVHGIPEGFEEMRRIIEEILPCHLEVDYLFWYIIWSQMEARFPTWSAAEGSGLSWGEIEKLVE